MCIRDRCSAMHEDGTNGTPRVPHECRNHAEAVILVCWSISYTQLVVCYTFIGHAGGTISTSPIQSFAGGPVSDLRARVFGTTQLALDRTGHTTSYVIKNAVISREKTRSRASAACERHGGRPHGFVHGHDFLAVTSVFEPSRKTTTTPRCAGEV